MNGYFYHGIEFYSGFVGDVIQLMIKILDEGLIVRSLALGFTDEKMHHICLYRKNDDFDYNDNLSFMNSARSGWIDGQFVFIINPNIVAKKAEEGIETDLIDEWRCYQNISSTNFVGIALPFKSIQEYLNENDIYIDEDEEKDKKAIRQYLPILIEKAQNMGLAIVDSETKDFTDSFDNNLYKRVL